jgi:hypothetical protein
MKKAKHWILPVLIALGIFALVMYIFLEELIGSFPLPWSFGQVLSK